MMRSMLPRYAGFRATANAVCIVAATHCISTSGTANEPEGITTRPPYHPYLAPAPPLTEMVRGDPVEREIAHSARILFPDLAEGSLPTTAFGTIVLHSFGLPYVLLFRETDGGTLVEKREIESRIHLRDPTPDERPDLRMVSKVIHPEIATASESAIRQALANARPHRPGGMRDGEVYYFFSRGVFGTAHSPGSASEAGRLVQLVRVLRQFVDGGVEERELRVVAEDTARSIRVPRRQAPGGNLRDSN